MKRQKLKKKLDMNRVIKWSLWQSKERKERKKRSLEYNVTIRVEKIYVSEKNSSSTEVQMFWVVHYITL